MNKNRFLIVQNLGLGILFSSSIDHVSRRSMKLVYFCNCFGDLRSAVSASEDSITWLIFNRQVRRIQIVPCLEAFFVLNPKMSLLWKKNQGLESQEASVSKTAQCQRFDFCLASQSSR